MTLQIVASLTDDTRSVNYDCNSFIIQATGPLSSPIFDRDGEKNDKMTVAAVLHSGKRRVQLEFSVSIPDI